MRFGDLVKKINNVDFGHFWVWKGESISGSYLGFLPSILLCLTWSNSAVVFFCVEPDVGMSLHQAQRYFKQLIDGVVGQSLIPIMFDVTVSKSVASNIKQGSANYLTSLCHRSFSSSLHFLGFALFWPRKLEVESNLVSLKYWVSCSPQCYAWSAFDFLSFGLIFVLVLFTHKTTLVGPLQWV